MSALKLMSEMKQTNECKIVSSLFKKYQKSIDIISITKVEEGFNHENWKVETQENAFFVKIFRKKKKAFINTLQAHELFSYKAVPAAPILYFSQPIAKAETYFLVQEWINGEKIEQILLSADGISKNLFINQLACTTRELHKIRGPFFSSKLIGGKKYKHWQDLCINEKERIYKDLEITGCPNFQLIRAAAKKLDELFYLISPDIQPSLVHKDLCKENIMWLKSKCYLLDFEYARFYDSLWDLVKIQFILLAEHKTFFRIFLDFYFEGSPSFEEIRRLHIYQGIELLETIHYFHRLNPHSKMFKVYNMLLEKWIKIVPEECLEL